MEVEQELTLIKSAADTKHHDDGDSHHHGLPLRGTWAAGGMGQQEPYKIFCSLLWQGGRPRA